MPTVHRYNSFEDLKNSGLRDKVTPSDTASAIARQEKWLDELRAATMVPAKRARKQRKNGK